MEEKKHTVCPLCNVEGNQLDGNALVWYHNFTDNRGAPGKHKWSVKSGRMFPVKATEEDSLW
jgi:hypothetical protein